VSLEIAPLIRAIVTDKTQLALVSALVEDISTYTGLITDLQDTAEHHRTTKIGCAGLAANQLGWLNRIILVWTGAEFEVMINPEWEPRDGKMASQHEGCLSRPSVNVKVKRHKRIVAEWTTPSGELRKQKFSHFTARVFQHEVAHLDGVYIGDN
jgi:peptide deformylase